MKTNLIKLMMCIILAAFVATGCERRYYEGNEDRHEHRHHHHYDNDDRRGDHDDHYDHDRR